MVGAECATTHPMLCPYNANAPLSFDGRLAWELFKDNAWRIKSAGLGGITGFDLEQAQRRLVAAGVEPEIAEDLLSAVASAAVKALNEKDDADVGKD